MWASNDPSSLVEGSSTKCPIILRVCPMHHGTLGGKTRSLDGALTLTKRKFTCFFCDISLNASPNDAVRLESHLCDEHDLGSSHHAICLCYVSEIKSRGGKNDARNCLANCGESNASHENMKFIRIGAHKEKLDPSVLIATTHVTTIITLLLHYFRYWVYNSYRFRSDFHEMNEVVTSRLCETRE